MADGMPLFAAGNRGQLQNIQAEQSLLGALMAKPQLLTALPANFEPSHYSDAMHAEIHRAVVEVGQPGVPASLAVMQALAINDQQHRGYIASLLSAIISYSPASIEQYAALVTDMYRRRGLVALSDQLRDGAFNGGPDASADGIIAQAATTLEELTAQRSDVRPNVSFNDVLDDAMAYADRASRGENIGGLSTGFPSIDERIGGLEAGTMTVIAARPGMGKSAIAHQMALSAARAGVGVLEVSLEMSRRQLGLRALSTASGIPLAALKHGRHVMSMSKLIAARRELHDLPLTIEDGGGLTAGMIAMKARASKRRHGLGLIMVDHLHIIRPDDGDVKQGATWAVGRISGAMKRLAKEMDCAVLVLAQLNRGVEGRDDKRPGLADLRHAGDIEQDADAVGFVYRAEYYLGGQPERQKGEQPEKYANRVTEYERDRIRLKGKAELIFPKVRDGEPGTVPLLFHAETTSFSEPEYDGE